MTILVWHDDVRRPAWQQMAIDRTLADIAAANGHSVYRLYRWERDTVSFGANEAARRTWDRERLERLEVPTVRRPTGGRGVWHDATDLTYAVTAPLARFADLRTAYRVIHEQLARALATLGVPATLAAATRRPTLAPGACFDLAIGGEVVVEGRKTIGSAQALFGPAFLQHGAIAAADHADTLARFRLEEVAIKPDIAAARMPPHDQLAGAIVTTWLEAGGTMAPRELTDRAIEESAAHAKRFGDPAWTWRR